MLQFLIHFSVVVPNPPNHRSYPPPLHTAPSPFQNDASMKESSEKMIVFIG